MATPPPPPAPDELALASAIVSHVNAGLEFIDDLAEDDERDELVEQMNLHGNSVQSMDGLEAFSGLVELCLSSNCIEDIAFHALQPLVQLRVLDLSANSISSTLGFPQLPRLEELSMAHNCLRGLDGLTRPVKFPKLRYLDLRGNELAEFSDLVSLQRLKKLSHLRLQAANGDQANPVCDLDDYPHAIIKMLPRLELLDEEEVEFLNEVGSLHMPKYRSLMRKIAEGKRSDRHPGRSPREASPSPAPPPTQHPRNQREGAQHRALPPRIRTDVDPAEHLEQPRRPASRDNVESSPELSSPRTDPPSLPAAASDSEEAKHQHMRLRVVLKDSETNTDVAFEKGISQREQVVAQKETDFLEKEKAFLTQEKEHFVKEGVLKAQIAELQGRLEHAEARAIKAESTVLEMSSHLVQKEKAQAAAVAASDESASALQQSQSDQQSEQEAAVAMLKASHQQEMEQLTAEKVELGTKCAQLKAAYAAMEQKLGQAEQRLQQTSASLDKSERRADGIAGELELARKTHDATASQLSGEVKRHKDRVEQADRRNAQLEQQVAELKANVETVYNKCIEKDEAAQQLKKSLAARQDDIEALRLQHGKDSERQDKLQQQQQDLYERQLQASVVQVEMEFRKEHQQSLQKFQLLQRKTQERWKEVKRVREAYQASLQREAAAKAEVVKLQAMLADDKKMLLVEDAKRADAFQAEIREERAKRKALDQRVLDEQKKYAEAAGLKAELEERTLESQRLRAELEQQRDAWTTLEDDLRAALKVKDVMLADQQRQIKELSGQSRQAEAQFSDEMADLQAQVEDLEAALDESIQKAAEEEVKSEALSARLAALEKDAPQKDEQLAELRAELEQKVSALEFLDQEMQRMRAVLENQDELFKKRMQKHLEQQREQVERVRASAEEERERQLRGWGAERGDMMHKYQVLAAEMASVAAQNAKLRTALDQERRKAAQNDRDMRILLVQIDRERQAKKENLRQIKSLFEQLQREAS